MKRYRIAAALLGTSVLFAAPAYAVNTGEFDVSLTIEHECTISATDLTFPNTGMIDHNVDATATVTVLCTDESPYEIGLGAGTHASGDIDERKLMGPGSRTIDYQFYTDNTYANVWGETNGEDTVGNSTATGSDDHTIYARVPSGQNVPAGVYTDTVIATVWYGGEVD